MKILFDTQIFDWQINGGISRYFMETIQRLDEDPATEILFKSGHSYNTYIQNTKWLKNRPVLKNLQFKGKLSAIKMINEKVNRVWSNGQLKKGEFDIFHPTYYDPYFLQRLGKKPFVLTVYDLTDEKFFDRRPLTVKVMEWKKKLILAADHIVSISENTKKDIIEIYGVDAAKITTVYLSGGFEKPLLEENIAGNDLPKVPENYVLYVGSRGAYKNFTGFIRELGPALVKEKLSLVIAGGGNLSADEIALLNKEGLGNSYTAFSHVPDSFLSWLYRHAELFVFPSKYEGFGIPVLEAMQCGCPALLSNNSSLPEVGGAAAEYFDPLQDGSMRAAFGKFLGDSEKRQEMIIEGLEQIKKFKWNATAEGHIAVYKKLLS